MKAAILILFVAFAHISFAQDTIVVRKDSRLETLTAKQASTNKLAGKMTSNGLYRGFRLQVLNTRSREQAFQVKTELLRRFPEEKTYLLYQSPYFKVRIGNFLERADAEEFRQMVMKQYPQGVFVIDDAIEYRPGAATSEETEPDSQ
ncbi:Sporulation related domain-containing protein [Filimonas lacunae]|uniref:Sporulation related domain-containing protein n=1 Tax=Filimonas lacunae TaxID=477680 RepID=A0A173M9M5_9BACT|nr:SPOR domain-containing protein [Filimonas lacunae]BAV04211.1 hypothetical protein FLA_0190 [Filimonas lacunae]SIT14149.1 Sporulation related domain-containing protein [Filimonas lacunae]